MSMNMRSYINKDIILSKSDIEKLKNEYENNKITFEYLYFDVKSIMINEGITKDEAIKRILEIIDKYK